MGADEEGTHERLKAYFRELVDPKIEEHRGRIVKNIGDGVLVEFPSVASAVRCVVEVASHRAAHRHQASATRTDASNARATVQKLHRPQLRRLHAVDASVATRRGRAGNRGGKAARQAKSRSEEVEVRSGADMAPALDGARGSVLHAGRKRGCATFIETWTVCRNRRRLRGRRFTGRRIQGRPTSDDHLSRHSPSRSVRLDALLPPL
jgi:hypothetical protein